MKPRKASRVALNALGGVAVVGISAYLFGVLLAFLWWVSSLLIEHRPPGFHARRVGLLQGAYWLFAAFPLIVLKFSWPFFIPAGALLGMYVGSKAPVPTPRLRFRLSLRAGTAVGLAAAAYMVVRGLVVPSLQPGVIGGSMLGLVSGSVLMFLGYAVLFVPFCFTCLWAYLRASNRLASSV